MSASCDLPVILTVIGVGISGIVATELIHTNLTNTVAVCVGMVLLTNGIYVVSAGGSIPVIVGVKGVYVRVGVVTELIVTIVTYTVVVLGVNVRCLGDCYVVSTGRSVPVSILVTGKGFSYGVVTELIATIVTDTVVVLGVNVRSLGDCYVVSTGRSVPVSFSVAGKNIGYGVVTELIVTLFAKSVVAFLVYVVKLSYGEVGVLTGDSVPVSFCVVGVCFSIGVCAHYVCTIIAKTVEVVYGINVRNYGRSKVGMLTGDSVPVSVFVRGVVLCVFMLAGFVSAIVAKTVEGFKVFGVVYVRSCLGSEVLMLTGDSVPVSVFIGGVLVCVGVSTHYICTNVAKTVIGFKVFGIVYVSCEVLGCFSVLGKNVVTNSLLPVTVLVSGPFGREVVVTELIFANLTNTVVVLVYVSDLIVGKNTVDKLVADGLVPVELCVILVIGGVGVLVLVTASGTLVICIPGVSCSFHGAAGGNVTALRGS